MKYKNIVFDLGGVIVDLKTRESVQKFVAMGMDMPEDLASGKTVNGTSEGGEFLKLIHAVDLGEINGDEFIEIVKSKCNPGTTSEQILEAYCTLIHMPESRVKLLLQLRKRFKVYLLSNVGDLHWKAACDASEAVGVTFSDCFDDMILSYKLHLAKPDPAIFQALIERTGIVPQETLYIDDLQANIDAGIKAGLAGYKIEPNRLEDYLEDLEKILD